MHSRSKKNIWTAPPLPRTMWVSNMHFLSSGYFRQKSWTQGMSFCMATDGYSDGCAIDLTRLRLLACWTAPWHQPHASNTTRVPPVDTPMWLYEIKDFTHFTQAKLQLRVRELEYLVSRFDQRGDQLLILLDSGLDACKPVLSKRQMKRLRFAAPKHVQSSCQFLWIKTNDRQRKQSWN